MSEFGMRSGASPSNGDARRVSPLLLKRGTQMSHPTYVLGSSPRELSRLSQQSQIIQPNTDRQESERDCAFWILVLELVTSRCLRLRWWDRQGRLSASIDRRRRSRTRKPAFAIVGFHKLTFMEVLLRSFLRMSHSMWWLDVMC
jgi:hypothetical protein